MAITENAIDDRIMRQYLSCRKNHYKQLVHNIIAIIIILGTALGAIWAWSYGPIEDLAVLKQNIIYQKEEISVMQKKLDTIILARRGQKIGVLKKKRSNAVDDTVIVDVLSLTSPALDAICQKRKK